MIDCVGHSELVLTESSSSGNMRFRGKFQEANSVNKNQRMYPYGVLNANVEKLQETIDGRGLFGELDHPTDSIIHLTNASHIVTKLWWESNVLMGEAEVLNTPSGKVLKSLMEAGSRVGISSRGVGQGTTNSEGVLEISESYKLITFDMVADPSTFAAFQTKITSKRESVEIAKVPYTPPRSNHKAVVSYFGAMLESKLDQIKNNIKKR